MTKWEIINTMGDIAIGVSLIALEMTKQQLEISPTVTPSTISPSTQSTTINPFPPQLLSGETNSTSSNVANIVMGVALLGKGLAPIGKAIYDKINCQRYQDIDDNASEVTVFSMQSAYNL